MNGSIFLDAQANPFGLFVNVNNTIYATEQQTKRVQVWSSQGGTPIRTFSGNLSNPGAIFVTTNGDIYIDSGDNRRVELWTSNATSGVIVMNVTNQCLGLFIDMNNTLYCAASDSHQVVARSLNGGSQSTVVVAGNGTCGSAVYQLCLPNGIFIDMNSNLYIADYANNRIQKYKLGQTNGQTVAVIGATATIDLSGPVGIALDADGYLFITDMRNNRIVGSGPNGYRCIVGCSQTSTSLTTALNGPRALGFDSYGSLFVADRENNRVVKFSLAMNSCGMSICCTQLSPSNFSIVFVVYVVRDLL